jgi:hypothetical protein
MNLDRLVARIFYLVMLLLCKFGSPFVGITPMSRFAMRRFAGSSLEGRTARVSGMVEKLLFRAPSGYTVAKLRLNEIESEYTSTRVPKVGKLMNIVGTKCPLIATAMVGDTLTCEGKWTENAKFGLQFEVISSKLSEPTAEEVGANSTGDSLRAWMVSGKLKGVGPKLADRIIEKFGNDTQQVTIYRQSLLIISYVSCFELVATNACALCFRTVCLSTIGVKPVG